MVAVFLGDDNQVKLGDFGLSKLMQSHDFASTYVGTPYYMSPEICAAERYTLHSDIWSLGCVMYELCARRPPFDAKTHLQLIQKIKDGRVEPLPSIYSPELQVAIKSCLKTNPHQRPDTAALLSLPIMRVMRKEREVVEIGKALRLKEVQLNAKRLDVENKATNLEVEREKMRAALDDTVRREWEVKARLAIDQHIQAEIQELQKRFEAEVRARVQTEVQQQLRSLNVTKPDSPVSPEDVAPCPSEKKEQSDHSALTDLSSLSLDSPTAHKASTQPAQRKPRGPLARSRTEFDSPMEPQLPAPSPMSIDCLSLSPRRGMAAAATNIPNSKNIFAAAARHKSKLHPFPSSPSSNTSLDQAIMEDSEDDVPELPSPTRRPSTKAPARPGLLRQKTAPPNRLSAAPALFPTKKPPRIPSPTNILPTGSPVRKAPPKPASAGGDEMLKAVMQRNMLGPAGQGGQGGRTLVELAQARAGGTQSAAPTVGAKGMMETGDGALAAPIKPRESEAPLWDPERDEMPSPFLVRGTKNMRKVMN